MCIRRGKGRWARWAELQTPQRVFWDSSGTRKELTLLMLGDDASEGMHEDKPPSAVMSAPGVERGACAEI